MDEDKPLTAAEKKKLISKEWRRSHFYKIKDKKKKLSTFKPNKAQIDFEKNRHTRNIILKSRQLGFTTYETVDSLDDILWTPNMDILFIAHTLEDAKDIFDNKISLAWENYALKDKYETDMDSARKLKVGFGDKTFSSISVATSGRSGTWSRLHITEFAKLCKTYPDRAREVIEGSIPAVPTEGRVDIESTADGSDGLFHDMFWKARDRGEPKFPTQFKAHFYNWTWDEEVEDQVIIDNFGELEKEFRDYQKLHKLTDQQISFYYIKYISLGEATRSWATMKQEYPTTPEEAFEGSGEKLFDLEKLGLQETREPIATHGDVRIFAPYKLGHAYGMGCDVAEGVGADSSTMVLWDFTPTKPEVVAEYQNNQIAPDMFAFEIKNLCEKFNYPLVCVERNNHGHTTLSKLKEIYPDRHIWKDDKKKHGWLAHVSTKPKIYYELNTALNEGHINFVSKRVISEARRYDKEDLRIVKASNDENTRHYDLLTAAVIGYQMVHFAHAPRNKRTRPASSVAKRGRKGMRGV